jgi:two-component system, cell cycle sensor histidine kinase and response regulator CckA
MTLKTDTQTKKTILVVDDEDIIREILEDALQDDYVIMSAPNGEEALALFMKHTSEIDLVITDLLMPKMRGDELAGKLHNAKENLPIIFITGFTSTIEPGKLSSRSNVTLLNKPFDIARLSALIAQSLA